MPQDSLIYQEPQSFAPSTAMSYDEYTNWNDQPWIVKGFDKYLNWGANKKKADNAYDAYLQNLGYQNEWKATQSARAYEQWFADTQYQRMVRDLEKAGLNPWLAVQNGISGSGNTSATKADYNTKSRDKDQVKGSNNLGLILVALARIIAAAA